MINPNSIKHDFTKHLTVLLIREQLDVNPVFLEIKKCIMNFSILIDLCMRATMRVVEDDVEDCGDNVLLLSNMRVANTAFTSLNEAFLSSIESISEAASEKNLSTKERIMFIQKSMSEQNLLLPKYKTLIVKLLGYCSLTIHQCSLASECYFDKYILPIVINTVFHDFTQFYSWITDTQNIFNYPNQPRKEKLFCYRKYAFLSNLLTIAIFREKKNGC